MTSVANTVFTMSPERLKQGALEALVAFGILLGAISLGHCGSGCHPQDVAYPTVHEVDYTTQIVACAEKAKTKAESRACRREVDLRWGVCVKTDSGERCPSDE